MGRRWAFGICKFELLNGFPGVWAGRKICGKGIAVGLVWVWI